ncbi:MAG TPA: hypothetical protein VEB22_09965 [Phycisphaerales bacterium]|nr:hypothetical protein [Phycisphaerales bacterium]
MSANFRDDLLYQISLLSKSVQRLTAVVANRDRILINDHEAAARLGAPHLKQPRKYMDNVVRGRNVRRCFVGNQRRWEVAEIDRLARELLEAPLPAFAAKPRPSRKQRRLRIAEP